MRWGRSVLPSVVAVLAVLGALPWVLAAHRALSPDEAGFLIVGGQWHHGASLYGDYWVDRPPGLIALFALVHAVGDAVGGAGAPIVVLRCLGALAAAVSVLLAYALGRSVVAAVLTAAVVATPLVDAGLVNGEILAVPFVLLGVGAAVRAARAAAVGTARTSARLSAVAAGVAAAAAALIKQNFVDVLVVALVLTVVGAAPLRRRLATLGTTLLAAAATLAVAVALAAAAGTRPLGLWHAVIEFRFRATRVIDASGTQAAGERFSQLMTDLVRTGIPLAALLLALLVVRRLVGADDRPDRPRELDLRWPALVLVGWETVGVLAGGSYWHHYLLGLVPGLALLATAAAQPRLPWPRTVLRRLPRLPPLPGGLPAVVGAVAAAAVVASTVLHVLTTPAPAPSATSASVQGWLHDHTEPGQTAVVTYGHADVLAGAGLRSPYTLLWSLPVKVRDPHLSRLARVLGGPTRPTWVVLYDRTSLAGWGLSDIGAAEAALERDYVVAGHPLNSVVYRARATGS